MQSTTALEAVREMLSVLAITEEQIGDLPAAFATVPDPRARRGQRYDLPFLLTCLVAALLCNCNSLDAVGEWCQHQRRLLRRYFGPRRHLTPTGSLYRRLLPRLSVAHLEAALAAWVQGSLNAEPDDALALDGKTVRGAVAAGARAPHLLSVSTHDSQETLVQVAVEEKTNEIPVARALLPALPLAGRILTADALHTQVETAQAILAHGGDYLLVVKRNQETLYAECAAYFSDPTARVGRTTTVDRRRGRTETRTLYVTTCLNAHLTRYSRFPHIGQVACLLTTVQDRRGTQREVRFLLTSLTPQQAPPARLLALARGHWRIESRHWTRDVTFGEDRARLRTGAGPQLMAALRTLVLTLIQRLGTSRSAAQRRAFAARPAHALHALGLCPC
jgi:predicted transposase YbfD/YdcC